MAETSAQGKESLVICLDNSDYMRNEDYMPTRWDAQKQACTWLFNNDEPPSMFAMVSMAGNRPEVISKSALDIHSIEAAIERTSISNTCTLSSSLLLAQMVLRNRPIKSTISRIVIFSGSPITESLATVVELGHALKKNKINLDVIAFGDASKTHLKVLVDAADIDGNCHFIDSPPDDDTLAVGMVSLVAPEVTPNLVSTPAPELPEQDIPTLKLPPANRVCRRVAVDPIKLAAAMHRTRLPLPSSLSISLTLSLSAPATPGKPKPTKRASTVVLLVPCPSRKSKNVLLEFRVGRCQFKNRKDVVPLAKKGQLSLTQLSATAFQVVWRHRITREVELDLILHPGEATFSKVETPCSADRVYCLHVTNADQRYFFWMQHNETEKDESYCSVINTTLAPRDSKPVEGGSVFNSLSGSELQYLLAMLARPPGQRTLFTGSDGMPQDLLPPSLQRRSKLTRSDGGSAIEGSRQRWIRNPLFASDDAPHRFRRPMPLTAVEKSSAVEIPIAAPCATELSSPSSVDSQTPSSSSSIAEIVHNYEPPSDSEDGPS